MGEKDEKPIRVVDRRMFTPDGELRPDFEPEEPAAPPPPPPPRPTSSPAAPPSATSGSVAPPGATPASASERMSAMGHGSGSPNEAEHPAPPGVEEEFGGETGGAAADERGSDPRSDFTAIIKSLATTAYSALGLLPDPAGGRHREPAVARQMIDWLSVLESRTRNNLSFEESDFLSRVLYELRMAFVEVVGPAGPPGAGRPRPSGR